MRAKPRRRRNSAKSKPARKRTKRADPREHQRAKLFWTGRSQAVRLPKEFRFSGSSVLIRREGRRVILEPEEDWPQGYIEWLKSAPFPDFEPPPRGPARRVDVP